MSLLSLCWHNKTLLPASCLKSPISQLANSCNTSWGLIIQDCGDGVVTGVHPPRWPGGDPTRHQQTAWSRGGFILLVSQDEGLRCTTEPSEVQEPAREGEHHSSTSKNLVQIQTCPKRQKGSLITSQWDILVTATLGMKPCLSGSGSGMEVQCCIRVYENASWDAVQLWTEWGVPCHSVSVWQAGNGRRWVEIRVRTLPWSV
jgi:hypothetical protein